MIEVEQWQSIINVLSLIFSPRAIAFATTVDAGLRLIGGTGLAQYEESLFMTAFRAQDPGLRKRSYGIIYDYRLLGFGIGDKALSRTDILLAITPAATINSIPRKHQGTAFRTKQSINLNSHEKLIL